MRLLKITSAQAYLVNGTKVWHQFSDTKHGFAHRIAVNGIGSEWMAHHGIATFRFGKRSFAATTEYWQDNLPRVFEIIKGKEDV